MNALKAFVVVAAALLVTLSAAAQTGTFTLISDPLDVSATWAEVEIDGATQNCSPASPCMAGGAISIDVTPFVTTPPRKFDARARACRVDTSGGTQCSGWTAQSFFDFTVPAIPTGLRVVAG